MANRLARWASSGSVSLKRTVGIAVSIDLKGPRIDDGASGFGSNVSSWLGPPVIMIRMARRWANAEAARTRADGVRPTTLRPPTRRKSRRDTPSPRSVPGSVPDISRSFFHQFLIQFVMTLPSLQRERNPPSLVGHAEYPRGSLPAGGIAYRSCNIDRPATGQHGGFEGTGKRNWSLGIRSGSAYPASWTSGNFWLDLAVRVGRGHSLSG